MNEMTQTFRILSELPPITGGANHKSAWRLACEYNPGKWVETHTGLKTAAPGHFGHLDKAEWSFASRKQDDGTISMFARYTPQNGQTP